jgi:8-oxo-dGTP diphosphatase
LIAQRLTGKHMAGWWEFPGGKLDGAETPQQALVRELREELGIEVGIAELLLSYTHDYPEQIVHLHVLRVTSYQGEPAGLEGQPLRWVAADQLMNAGLLEADQLIVDALCNDSP